MTAIQLGVFLNSCNFRTLLTKALQQFFADGGMRHLTTAETDSDFDTVAFLQELLGILQFDVEIVGVDAGRHAYFLDLDHTLVLLGFLFLLQLFEAELAIIHDLADRGNRVGCDLNQIQILFICHSLCIGRRHDTQLGTVSANNPNFLIPDFLIELMF